MQVECIMPRCLPKQLHFFSDCKPDDDLTKNDDHGYCESESAEVDYNVPQGSSNSSTLHFSVRKLALITLALLVFSQLLALSVWRSGHTKKVTRGETPLVTHWKVSDNNPGNTEVHLRAIQSAEPVGYLSPGTIVQAYEYEHSNKYLFLMTPLNGFALKNIFEPVSGQGMYNASPYLYEGYRKENRNMTARYLFAPTRLVVAQQMWNALQVSQILLVISLFYVHVVCRTSSWRKCWIIGLVWATPFLLLVPFSIYVTSPGATLFALVSLVSSIVAIMGGRTELVLDVGKHAKDSCLPSDQVKLVNIMAMGDDDETDMEQARRAVSHCRRGSTVASSTSAAWFLVREEMLGFLCIIASGVNNYTDSHKTWPDWHQHILRMDDHFGLTGGGFENENFFMPDIYTLGLPNLDMPLYIPQARGLTMGDHLYWIMWSFIPVVCISLFLCMYLLAPRSPGVKIQRALLLFSIFHFLFMTGKCDLSFSYLATTPTLDST